MTPYYADDFATIYHGDCREVLPSLDFDVMVTDPPYGMGHYETDQTVLTPAMLQEIAASHPVAVFGYPERLVSLCVVAGLVPDEWVTWWATNAAIKAFGLTGLWSESECVAIFGAHHMGELRQARTPSSRRIIAAAYVSQTGLKRLDSDGHPDDRRLPDVWTDPAPGLAFQSHRRLHPNEKPLAIMLRLVEGMTREGQTVLDPFMGSGTTLRAAKDLGRRSIGCEVVEAHCEIAAKRLAQEVLDFGGVA